MKEFELIAQLTHSLPSNKFVVVGAGDDCAVLDFGLPDRLVLFKTDAVVEGIHFKPDTTAEKIGHKALGRCLSDVAAMAGTPVAALVTIGLPAEYDAGRLQRLYAGMSTLARKHDTAIVGGETTVNPAGLIISVSLVGSVPRGKAVLRSGAEPGDALFVTGELGGSMSGRHLEFEPRLEEARWLNRHFSIHSMIDLSDGLAGDLRHILKASRVGAELLASSIPISRAAKEASRKTTRGEAELQPHAAPKTPLSAALGDGEDFELLFTVAGGDAVSLLDAWRLEFPKIRLTCVGKITAGEGVHLRDKEGVRPLSVHGYEHFS